MKTTHYYNTPVHSNAIFHGSINSISEKKICNIFHINGPKIDCGCLSELPHWGGSNKHTQSMSVEKNKSNNVYPCKPHFSLYKVGLWGCSLHRLVNVIICHYNTFGRCKRWSLGRTTEVAWNSLSLGDKVLHKKVKKKKMVLTFSV